MTAYYNENDPFAAAWLQQLIVADLIAPGVVDTRSIEDVTPNDLSGFTQCHFFAGIGIWSLAARVAGWPDERPLWTGSCPCQPFSAAGKGGGFADERHLWPAFHWLIDQCRPERIVGEQVASRDGLGWLDLVSADLEGSGYAVGAVDTCAAGFGAPHIRQRLYWVAHSSALGRSQSGEREAGAGGGRAGQRRDAGGVAVPHGGQRDGFADGEGRERDGSTAGREQGDGQPQRSGATGGLADARYGPRRDDRELSGAPCEDERAAPGEGRNVGAGAAWDSGATGGVADAERQGPQGRADDSLSGPRGRKEGDGAGRGGARLAGGEPRPGPTNGLWRDADWLRCRDEKWRPVEPATFPLADAGAFRNRVGLLRGAGNAINLAQAAAFIGAMM